jgi:hypothetical protein
MIQFKGGNGSSIEKAIIILGVNTDREGVDAEYRYLDFHYKGWQLDEQTLILNKDMQYDLMVIILLDGSKKDVWFDITEFCC